MWCCAKNSVDFKESVLVVPGPVRTPAPARLVREPSVDFSAPSQNLAVQELTAQAIDTYSRSQLLRDPVVLAPQEEKSSMDSFQNVLEDPVVVEAFKVFAKKEFSLNEINCVLEIRALFPKLNEIQANADGNINDETIIKTILDIRDKFLLESSKFDNELGIGRTNLNAPQNKKIVSVLSGNVFNLDEVKKLFDSIQSRLYEQIAKDTFVRFKKTR